MYTMPPYVSSFIVHGVASTDVLRSKIAYEPWTVLRMQVLGFQCRPGARRVTSLRGNSTLVISLSPCVRERSFVMLFLPSISELLDVMNK